MDKRIRRDRVLKKQALLARGILRMDVSKGRSLMERIENLTYYSPDGCHYWLGVVSSKGYAFYRINNTMKSLSRFMYASFKGIVPDEMQICHHCDNPRCINPDHLWLGTNQDNVDDKMRKGRHRYSKNKYVTTHKT